MSGEPGLGLQLETFRETRRNLEASVLPLATSVDGRRFSFQASLHGLQMEVGGYVVLDGGGTARLIERSVTFRPGEGLIAGKISPQPALLRFDARITQEGGADVPATWADAR